MNIINFIRGRKRCWECDGTGQSPRGYEDFSSCSTCGETGWIKISRFLVVIDVVVTFFKSIKRIMSDG